MLVKIYYRNINWNENPIMEDEVHLKNAINWLSKAQEVTNCGGVSCYYDIITKKWGKPYRETTGYIAETFIDYFHYTNNKIYLENAIKMGDWEISVQCDDGAFGEVKKDGTIGKKIFNTGQIIIGLISLYKETKDEKYLNAAKKAGLWIIKNQDQDGSWKNFSTLGPKTYDARVAWPLLQIYKVTNDNVFLEASKKSIQWIIKQQLSNYWFDNTSLSEENKPWTHLIAYTINGLIEYYNISDDKDKKIFDSFYNSANKLLEIFLQNDKQLLPCTFDKDWKSEDKYSCLTGDAQLAIVWLQIYNITKEKKFFDGAEKMINLVKKTQIIETTNENIRGGIFGSSPIDGDYGSFLLLNWAAKFFADSLILKKKTKI